MIAATVAVVAWACTAATPYVWFTEVPQTPSQRLTVVEPGDKVAVVVLDHPELSGEHTVAADGTYIQQLAGPTVVGGKTLVDGARHVAERLTPYLQQPMVQLTLVEPHLINVSVLGEVRTPGTFEVRYDTTLLSVLARGGGFSDFADEDQIYLVRGDGASPQIRFRYSDLVRPDPRIAGFELRDGDTILVR